METEIKLQNIPDVKKAIGWAENEIRLAKKEGRKLAIELNLTNVYGFRPQMSLSEVHKIQLKESILEALDTPERLLTNILKDKMKDKSIDIGSGLKLLNP